MGIKGLAKLLSEEAPGCLTEVSLHSLHGRKIAIDASMAIYQFLIAVRSGSNTNPSMVLTNAEGETTSHVQGFFNRTIRFLTEGILPVYVFDGKPPDIKSCELTKRREKREKAEVELKKAREEGDLEGMEKQEKRLVRAGVKENEDCIQLLELMGVPVVRAPCEAEAQAAAMSRDGVVWAVGTEDMDALTFRTTVLLRKMTFANASKSDIHKIEYQKVIDGLELTHDQFVDLCILLGCDYCDSIRGIGPKTALKLLREHGSIEKILENLDREKYSVPDSWVPNDVKGETVDEPVKQEEDATKVEEDTKETLEPIYVKARRLFNDHEVHDSVNIKWKECQPEKLTTYLVDKMGFNEDRVKASIVKLQIAFNKTKKPQMRMDSFFKVKPGTENKRKPKVDLKKNGKVKKKKGFFGKK